jgi:phage-related protein
MPDQYSVEPYKDKDGSYPVILYLEGLIPKERVVMDDAIKILSELGPDAPKMEAFKRYNDHLFEITKGHNRIIYLRDGNYFELLHGFPKHQKKTPEKDRLIAEERYTEYWRRKNK